MMPYTREWFIAWLMALTITLAAEVPAYVWQLGRPRARAVLVGATASLLTHPVLWYVVTPWLMRSPSLGWNPVTWAAAEAVISLVEGLWVWAWYRSRLSFGACVRIALIANLTSIIVGEIVRPLVPYL